MVQAVLGVLALAGVGLGGSVVFAAVSDDAADDPRTKTLVTRVIDGDTVEIDSGEHVRLIGVDTPERDTCGFKAATRAMRRMVAGEEVTLVNPPSVQDLDKYDRLLRFVEVGDRDAGLAQIRSGRATARYDSRDGYDPHPRERRYHRADRANEGACERKARMQEKQQQLREERWRKARRAANRANIRIQHGETVTHVLRRAREVIRERKRVRELVKRAAAAPVPEPAPASEPPTSGFVPPAGWTTDTLTPGYTGCRQGYPGGTINGVYVWKPIDC